MSWIKHFFKTHTTLFHSQNNKTTEVKQIPVKRVGNQKKKKKVSEIKVLQMVHSVDSSHFNFFQKIK